MSTGLRLCTLLLLLAPAPAMAAEDQPPAWPDQQTQEQWRRAEELARKGMEELLQSFELFKEGLPDYGAPYVNRNGDIVLPRKPRTTPKPGTPVPAPRPERI